MFFHIFTIIEIWVMIIIYIVRISTNLNFDQSNKIVWIVLIFFGSIITMPIYWYLCIWQEKSGKLIMN
ncbi:MAG: hypothetical protein PHV06_01855, partial [bacterium]|nr:hypothetical protein [bacterium]